MPSPIPPVPFNDDAGSSTWQHFFTLLRKWVNEPNFYASTADPGTTNVPSGTWSVWKNTTSGVVKLWVNDGGVMKSVTLS